jgi:hypothetical protein
MVMERARKHGARAAWGGARLNYNRVTSSRRDESEVGFGGTAHQPMSAATTPAMKMSGP